MARIGTAIVLVPSPEPGVHTFPQAIPLRQVPPWDPCIQPVQYPIEHHPVVLSRPSSMLWLFWRQQVFHFFPLFLCHFMSFHSSILPLFLFGEYHLFEDTREYHKVIPVNKIPPGGAGGDFIYRLLFFAELVPISHDKDEQDDDRQDIRDIEPHGPGEAHPRSFVGLAEEVFPAPASSGGAEQDIEQGA